MKKLLLFLSFCLASFCSFSQSSGEKSVKAFISIQYMQFHPLRSNNMFRIQPTFALSDMTSRGNIHEGQFVLFAIHTEQRDNFAAKRISAAMRYSYNIAILKSKDMQIRPFIGFGGTPYYEWARYDFTDPSGYSAKSTEGGVHLDIIPRIIWNLSEKVFLDFNLPVRLGTLRYYRHNYFTPNPADTKNDAGRISLTSLPRHYELNAGLGVRF